jgi:hypothetical protein
MKVQILSNLWGKLPPKFVRTAPTLILAGNIGQLYGIQTAKTISLVNQLSKGFKNVFWIPHVAETFMGDGRPIDIQVLRNLVQGCTNSQLLCNDVVSVGGKILVAASGLKSGQYGAPDSKQIAWWEDEEKEFVKENATVDTVLISAGSMYYWKPKTVIIGTPPPGYGNLISHTEGQSIYTNSANHGGFCPNLKFELH